MDRNDSFHHDVISTIAYNTAKPTESGQMTDSEYGAPTENINDTWLEAFLDAGAETLADIRHDWTREKELIQAQNRQMTSDLDALLVPLKERIARLEGEVAVLASVFGDAADSRARSKRLRQQQDNGHSGLLEAPQAQ
jgi:hypothetical protein